MAKPLTAKASIGIQKPVAEVFYAIVDPEKMKHYFISRGSGRLESGKEVQWSFPEFDGSFPVTVKEVVNNERISFIWDADSTVTIMLEKRSDADTVVYVKEEGHDADESGIKWAIAQTEGWANFLACMKAYLEYGIHLRKGAFDFMKK